MFFEKRIKGKENFVKQAQQIHKDDNGNPLYNYDNVNYVTSKIPVTITCPKHGDFEKTKKK